MYAVATLTLSEKTGYVVYRNLSDEVSVVVKGVINLGSRRKRRARRAADPSS